MESHSWTGSLCRQKFKNYEEKRREDQKNGSLISGDYHFEIPQVEPWSLFLFHLESECFNNQDSM